MVAAATLACAPAQASLITFDNLAVESATPQVLIDGLTLTFDNLMTIAVGSTTHGFGGLAGSHVVVPGDTANFSGRFLTASGYGRAAFRPTDFTRTISFSSAVADVAMYLADVDASQGIRVNLFDAADSLLQSHLFAADRNQDSRAILADFTGVSGVRRMTLVGDDPIGIDNLSFSAVSAPHALPEPATAGLAGLALVAGMASRRRRSTP